MQQQLGQSCAQRRPTGLFYDDSSGITTIGRKQKSSQALVTLHAIFVLQQCVRQARLDQFSPQRFEDLNRGPVPEFCLFRITAHKRQSSENQMGPPFGFHEACSRSQFQGARCSLIRLLNDLPRLHSRQPGQHVVGSAAYRQSQRLSPPAQSQTFQMPRAKLASEPERAIRRLSQIVGGA